MSHRDSLLAFARQEGFRVTEGADRVTLEGVPCLLEHGEVGHCTIEKSFDPANEAPTNTIGDVCHAIRILFPSGTVPRVCQANGNPIGNEIGAAPQDDPPWVNVSIRRGGPASPENDETVWHVVHRYAKQIIGAVKERERHQTHSPVTHDVFRIPNTFEGRAGVGPMQERIRDQSVAIIGLGGTGSYVLDLLAKTPVAAIHLCDDDEMNWHNFMRAPGAPTRDEIDSQHNAAPKKVNYYYGKYASFRKGIHPHAIRVGTATEFNAFLAEHPIDFAFVSIDQSREGDSPRQDGVYAALSAAGIPYIDSGISLKLEDDRIRGAVTTSSYASGSSDWEWAIPNARVTGDRPGYRNTQLPEVNALAAALAVMEWRRRTGQYVNDTKSFLHKFRLERAHVTWAGQSHGDP